MKPTTLKRVTEAEVKKLMGNAAGRFNRFMEDRVRGMSGGTFWTRWLNNMVFCAGLLLMVVAAVAAVALAVIILHSLLVDLSPALAFTLLGLGLFLLITAIPVIKP